MGHFARIPQSGLAAGFIDRQFELNTGYEGDMRAPARTASRSVEGGATGYLLKQSAATAFGKGASFAGLSSSARGAVTPPQLLAFVRELAGWLRPQGIDLVEHAGYVGRSDDISMMQFTPNVSIIGYPSAYSHFEQPPLAYMSDLVNLTKTLVMLALIAQDDDWQQTYL